MPELENLSQNGRIVSLYDFDIRRRSIMRKNILAGSTALLSILCAEIFGQEGEFNWIMNLKKAEQMAKDTGKPMLVVFR
tara:strand:- start:4 stop:240 length:237 start_codon:yes stop_codon:yes gene_type:complete